MLRISTKGRYATRILTYLAGQGTPVPARTQDIAASEGISADYVEQILMKLKSGGLVRSHRGTRGGFSLARDPRRITVAEVLRVTEGPIELVPCEQECCVRANKCVTRCVWERASSALQEVFAGVTVAEMAATAGALRAAEGQSFEI